LHGGPAPKLLVFFVTELQAKINFCFKLEKMLQKQTLFENVYGNGALYLRRAFQWLEELELALRGRQLLEIRKRLQCL
jgi:hypothetical protein